MITEARAVHVLVDFISSPAFAIAAYAIWITVLAYAILGVCRPLAPKGK